MKYQLFRTNSFKRAFKNRKLTDKETQAFVDVLYKLLNGIELDKKHCDHNLKGELSKYRECHIKPDLLLVYLIEDDILRLVDIGTHSELFD